MFLQPGTAGSDLASKTFSWKSSWGWYKDGIFPQETRWPNCTAWHLLTLMSFTFTSTEALVLLDWRVTPHHFINTFFFRLLSKVSENVSSPNSKWAGKGMQPSHSWWGKNASWNSSLVDGFAAYLEKYEILEKETDLWLFRSLQKSARKRGRNGTGMLLNCGVGEDSWESLALQEIKPTHPKGNQSRVFIGRTDVETETPILWPPDANSWLIWKDPDVGKDWRQEEKWTTEDEMVGWHHRLNGHEFEQVLQDGEGQGSLECCSPWGRRVGHDWVTEQQQAVTLHPGEVQGCSGHQVTPVSADSAQARVSRDPQPFPVCLRVWSLRPLYIKDNT